MAERPEKTYNQKVSRSLRKLRKTMRLSAGELAENLQIHRTTFDRAEAGLWPFSPGQVKILAHRLGLTHYGIYALAETGSQLSLRRRVLRKIVLICEGVTKNISFTKAESLYLEQKLGITLSKKGGKVKKLGRP